MKLYRWIKKCFYLWCLTMFSHMQSHLSLSNLGSFIWMSQLKIWDFKLFFQDHSVHNRWCHSSIYDLKRFVRWLNLIAVQIWYLTNFKATWNGICMNFAETSKPISQEHGFFSRLDPSSSFCFSCRSFLFFKPFVNPRSLFPHLENRDHNSSCLVELC